MGAICADLKGSYPLSPLWRSALAESIKVNWPPPAASWTAGRRGKVTGEKVAQVEGPGKRDLYFSPPKTVPCCLLSDLTQNRRPPSFGSATAYDLKSNSERKLPSRSNTKTIIRSLSSPLESEDAEKVETLEEIRRE